ncbi:TetR/AcrR family transcriptional regulator [Amycolatopsis vancoresmycina]|uniref:TetR family transcriptional regulator n=1 Tax=Amycolatopsis vancoresmycina DSM 44592 TaxID=1292037 RepID=R1I3Y8_9PSEU|nr:TetR/AcrR family transcriptional regulator [Amycolatopsis vancoresmycina]EOD70475.1 TetR family transcriptional regulator [Amycolatopsis vancoresmycina DSM 44592]
MAGRSSNATSTRDRLLLAAGQLLHEAGDGPVSTRAICERAGVQAPTLYHHFGSKQGLLDAVVNYGFTQYVQVPSADGDPVDRIRAGWDRHVEYGLEHPAFYVLLYGQIEPGVPCNLTSSAEAMLLELFTPLARDGRLRVEAAEAARQFAAANSGVTLSLIAQPEDRRDLAMSAQVRESVLAGLLADEPAEGSSVSALAVALSTALEDDTDALTTTERQMLREWLHRLAA